MASHGVNVSGRKDEVEHRSGNRRINTLLDTGNEQGDKTTAADVDGVGVSRPTNGAAARVRGGRPRGEENGRTDTARWLSCCWRVEHGTGVKSKAAATAAVVLSVIREKLRRGGASDGRLNQTGCVCVCCYRFAMITGADVPTALPPVRCCMKV